MFRTVPPLVEPVEGLTLVMAGAASAPGAKARLERVRSAARTRGVALFMVHRCWFAREAPL
jgi:hypothetical protein